MISYGRPDEREHHYLRDHLGFDLKTVAHEKVQEEYNKPEYAHIPKVNHHIFILTKLPGANEKSKLHFERVLKDIENEIAKEMEEQEGSQEEEGVDQKQENKLLTALEKEIETYDEMKSKRDSNDKENI